MKMFKKENLWFILAEFVGIIILHFLNDVYSLYDFFFFLFGKSLGSPIFLWSEFLLYMLYTIAASVMFLKWKSVTYWFLSTVIYIVLLLYFIPKMIIAFNITLLDFDKSNIWKIAEYLIIFQVILIITYVCIHYILYAFHERIDRKEQKIKGWVSQKYYKSTSMMARSYETAFSYVKNLKTHKYLYFLYCESCAILLVIMSWLLGFSPILLIGMLFADSGSYIVILGNMVLMSVLTIFIASHLLKMNKWYAWLLSLSFCVIGGWVLLHQTGTEIAIEHIVSSVYSLIVLFCGFLILSQIALLLTYQIIYLLSQSLKKHGK